MYNLLKGKCPELYNTCARIVLACTRMYSHVLSNSKHLRRLSHDLQRKQQQNPVGKVFLE